MAQADTRQSSQENQQLTALDQQIEAHHTADQSRSWVGYVASQFWRGDRTSLNDLEELSQQAHEAEKRGDTAQLNQVNQHVQQRIDADKKALATQDEIGSYTASGLKMATLFLGAGRFALSGVGVLGMEGAGTAGWLGMAGSIGIAAADRAKVSDTGWGLATNLAIGGSEGLVTKSLANGILSAGMRDALPNASFGELITGLGAKQTGSEAAASIAARALENPTAKGVLLSTTLRGVDLAYNDATYRDAQGNYSARAAAANLLGGTFDLKAIAVDAAMFGTVNSLSRVVTGGQAVRPLYHTMITSGTLGLGGGAYGEISKEWNSGQALNWGEIGRRSLIQGGVFALSGIPGGVVADPAFRGNPVQSVRNDVASGINNVNAGLNETAAAMAAAILPGDSMGMGMRPAYAMADAGVPSGLAPTAIDIRPTAIDTTSSIGPERAQPMAMSVGVEAPPPQPVSNIEPTVPEPALPASEYTPPVQMDLDLFGQGSVDARQEAESKLAPEELAIARQEAESFVKTVSGPNPGYYETRAICEYLADHPAVDSHMANLYIEAVRNSDMPNRAGIVNVLDAYYQPPVARWREISTLSPDAQTVAIHAFDWLDKDLSNKFPGGLELSAQRVRNLMSDADRAGIDLTDSLHQFARTTNNPHLAAIVDRALVLATPEGQMAEPTNYAGLIHEFGSTRRELPLTSAQLDILNDSAQWRAPATATLADVWPGAIPSAADAVPEADGLLDANGQRAGVAGVAPASAEATAGIKTALERLNSTDSGVRMGRLIELSRALDHPSSPEWFDTWKRALLETVPSGARSQMNSAEVQALPPETIRRALGSDWTFPGAKPEDVMIDKIGLLRNLAYQFKTSAAESADTTLDLASINKIVELGRNNQGQDQISNILRTISRGRDGATDQEYKDWLVNKLSTATSLDGLAGVKDPVKNFLNPPVRMGLEKAFPGSVETVDALLARAQEDPKLKLQDLIFKLTAPKAEISGPWRQIVQEKLAANAPNSELNHEYLDKLIYIPRAFPQSPQAGTLLREFARSADPKTVIDLMTDLYLPPPAKPGQRGKVQRPQVTDSQRTLNSGYRNLMGELIPRAAANFGVYEANISEIPPQQLQQISQTIIKQLEAVSTTLKTSPANLAAAEAAVSAIIPENDPDFGRASEFVMAIAKDKPESMPPTQKAQTFAPPKLPKPSPTPPADHPPTPPTDLDKDAANNGDDLGANPGPARESDAIGDDTDSSKHTAGDDENIVLNTPEIAVPGSAVEKVEGSVKDAGAVEEEKLPGGEIAAVSPPATADEYLHEIDEALELGGSSALFRRVDTMFEKQPIDSSAYSSMLNDSLEPFGSSVQGERGYHLFSDRGDAELFAENVADHITEYLDGADKVGYRLESIGTNGVEKSLAVIEIKDEKGRTISGTPVFDFQANVIGLSPLLGVEAPVPGAVVATPPAEATEPAKAKPVAAPAPNLQPLDQAGLEAALQKLQGKWGDSDIGGNHRGSRRNRD
jgi:hypothetical protein